MEAAVRHGGMGFLKKCDDPRFHLARQALLNGIKAGRIKPLDPIVANEVRAAVSSWNASKKWERVTEKSAPYLLAQDSKHDVLQMTRSSEQ